MLFCGTSESKDHLFFVCPYFSKVWTNVYDAIRKAGHAPVGWENFLTWAFTALKRNTSLNLIVKLGVSSCIYHIWVERNCRLHDGIPCSAVALSLLILQDLRDRVTGIPWLKKNYATAEFHLKI